MKLYFTTILVFLFSSLFGQAMWNEPLPIRQSGNLEWYNSSILTENNEMIHVWSETTYETNHIFATKLDSEGNPLWGEEPIQVNTSSIDEQDLKVITTSDDGCIIIWKDGLSQPNTLKAQKLNSSGSLLWLENGVTLGENYDGYSGHLFPNSNGGAVVVWLEETFLAVSLDSNGVNQWGEEPFALDAHSRDKVISDGFGGLLIVRLSTEYSSNAFFVSRIDDSGEVVWTQEMDTASDYIEEIDVDVIYNNVDSYYITVRGGIYSEDWPDLPSILKINKISLNGEIADNQVSITYPDYPYGYTSFTTNNNGDLFISENIRSSSTHLFYRRNYCLDQQLDHVWNETGVTLNSSSNTWFDEPFGMESDDSGSLFIIMRGTVSVDINGHYMEQMKLFSIDSSGVVQTEEDGQLISSARRFTGQPYIKKSDDLYIALCDRSNGIIKLKQHVYDISLQSTTSQVVKSSLGDEIAGNSKIMSYPVANNESTISIWQDFRDRRQIMYQKVNSDGSVDFTIDGIAIAEGDKSPQMNYTSIQNDSGEICVVWVSQENVIKTRTIDSTGSLIGNNSGEIIYEEPGFPDNNGWVILDKLSLSVYNNEFYLGWSREDVAGNMKVYTTYTTQGGSEWEEIPIQITPTYLFELRSVEMLNNYLIYKNDYNYSVYKIGQDGVATDMGEFPTTSEVEFACDTANTLFYTWRSSNYQIWIQGITDTNNDFFVGPVRVSYHAGPGPRVYGTEPHLSLTDNAIFVSWLQSPDYSFNELRAQKVSHAGQSEWIQEGIVLANHDNVIDYHLTPQTTNDFLVATWSELNNYRAKLKVNLINSTGALLLDANGVQLYDSLQAQLVASTTRLANNKTMFTWVQEADAYPRFGSLYAQMLDFTTVDNDNNDSEPLTLNLLQNYPNPFNPETTIAFNVPNSGLVKLEVYNLKGQKVKTLINDNLISGKHSVVWNGRDNNNKHVASGVYFYRLKSDGNSQTNKMILMK